MSGQTIYTYVGGDPVSFVDPWGQFGLPGMAGSFAFEVGMQMAGNYIGGKPIFGCIDWGDVAAATLAGAFVPPGLSELGRAAKAARAIPTLRANLRNAEAVGSNALKHQARLNQRIDTAIDASVNIAYGATVKHAAKEAVPPTTE